MFWKFPFVREKQVSRSRLSKKKKKKKRENNDKKKNRKKIYWVKKEDRARS